MTSSAPRFVRRRGGFGTTPAASLNNSVAGSDPSKKGGPYGRAVFVAFSRGASGKIVVFNLDRGSIGVPAVQSVISRKRSRKTTKLCDRLPSGSQCLATARAASIFLKPLRK